MKALRVVLYFLTGLIVVILVAAVIAIRSFDLNDYKDEITAYVQDRTGRTLAMNEDIEFSLFPWFAVETGDVSLSDDPAFGDRSFVNIDSFSARVRVWPLLRRRIEIGRIILDGITLNLGIDAEGQGNWATLLPANEPEAPSIEAPEPQRQAFEQFAVEGVELRNSRILWHDANGEVTYIVRDLELTTGPVKDNDPVDLSVSLSLLDVATQASVEIELDSIASIRPRSELTETAGTIRVLDSRGQTRTTAAIELDSISLDANMLRAGPLAVEADLLRPPLGPDEVEFVATITAIELDTDSEQLVLTGLSARTGGLNANLNIRGDAVLSDPGFAGTIDLNSASIAALFEALGSEPPADIRAADTGGFAANARFSLQPLTRSLTLERFSLTALGLEATGTAALGADQVMVADVAIPAFQPTANLVALTEARLPDGVDLSAITRASLSARLEFAAVSGALVIPEFALALDNATISGEMTIDDLSTPDRIDGRLAASGLDNRLLAALFDSWLPAELVKADLGNFELATGFDYGFTSKIASFTPLQLMAYGLSGEGQLTVVNSGSALTLSGRAALAEFSPRELLQRFELPVPQTSDPAVFRTAELAASFQTNGASGDFRDIAIELDDSRITGEFSVQDFADPSYRFILRADRIDADRYLPPRAVPAGAPSGDVGEKRLGDMRLANDALTATNVRGTASVGNLRIGGMDFSQLAAEMAFGGGRAALSPVSTQLYGGEFAGGLEIDATGETSVVHLMGDASNVTIRPLLEAMLGGAYLSGTGNIKLDLTGRGNTITEALQTAAGILNLDLRNGTIEGVNLGRRLCVTVNSARNLPAPASAPAITTYSAIRGTSVVRDGNASSSDLLVSTGYVDLTGRGGIRLVDQWIDNQYRATLTGPIPIAGCEDLNRTIANNPIPVNFTIKGRLPDIDVGVDISQLLQDWVRRELRQRAEEQVQDAILDRLFN
jgi:AsmA protein